VTAKILVADDEQNIVRLSTFTYTHQDLASRAWITDYGILAVYRG